MVKTFTNRVENYFIPINSGIPSLVEYREAVRQLLNSGTTYFYSLGFPQNRTVMIDGRSRIYKNLSINEQYNYLTYLLRRVALTVWNSRDSITRFRNSDCRKIKAEIAPDLQYDGYSAEKEPLNRNLCEKAIVIFEVTKNGNLHFHMLCDCKTRQDSRLIQLILLDRMGINKKSDDADTILNVRNVSDPDGMYEYMCNKKQKDYENLDWIKYKPLFLSEPIIYKYDEVCEESKENLQSCKEALRQT
jgi:hypothetical protein